LEDNLTLALSLQKALTKSGYAVDMLDDGEDGQNALDQGQYDLLILDLGLPNLDGIDILVNLRKQKNNIPILIISARDKLDQKILGFQNGADDYLTKPFALDEVVVRVNALLRRTFQDGQHLIEINNLLYDYTSKKLTKDGKMIELSQRELSVFEYLLANKNSVVSKDKIVDHITSYDSDIFSTTIETYISRLRKKLGDSFSLKTIRGLGYMLVLEK
jgi:DNA-binding response OmpR family regulator